MVLRKLMGLFACALILGTAVFATAGIPDLQTSTASLAYGGTETLSLFNVPNGAGKPFTQAFEFGGAVVDGTINLTLLDGLSVPIANFPFEDLWVSSADDGMKPCGGTATADFNTNDLGETSWVNALFAGGSSQALCVVYVNGDALTSSGGFALSFNSPDITGDGVVNLSDAGFFTGYIGNVEFKGDFNNSGGVVNIQDAGFMSAALGARCP